MELITIIKKSIILKPNSKGITLKQIDRCHECCKNGGLIVYNNQAYQFEDFSEFICALKLEQKKLDIVYDMYGKEMMATQQKISESDKMTEFRKHIADFFFKDSKHTKLWK